MSDAMLKFIRLMWKTNKVNEDDLEQLVNDRFLTMDEYDEIVAIEKVVIDE